MNGFFAPAGNMPVNEQQYQQGRKHHRDDLHRIDLQGIGGNFDFLIINGFNPVTPNQKTMGIDTVGGAGHERDLVLAGDDGELVGLGGENDEDLLDLVGEDFIQDVDGEGIALDDLVKVGEKPCARQPPMPGNDGMGGRAADGKAGALDMPGRDLQDALRGAVINGQLHVDIGDGHIAHDAGAGDIENVVIAGDGIEIREGCVEVCKLFIVGVGFGKEFFRLAVVHLSDYFFVVQHNLVLIMSIPPVGKRGVKHHGETHKENEAENRSCQNITLLF